MKNRRYGNGAGLVKSVLVGTTASCVAAGVLMSIVSLLIQQEKLALSNVDICVPFVHFAVLLVGTMSAGMISKEKILYAVGIVFGVLYFLCAGITILVFDGQFNGVIGNAGFGLLGALSAFFICIRRLKKGNKQFRKRKIC